MNTGAERAKPDKSDVGSSFWSYKGRCFGECLFVLHATRYDSQKGKDWVSHPTTEAPKGLQKKAGWRRGLPSRWGL